MDIKRTFSNGFIYPNLTDVNSIAVGSLIDFVINFIIGIIGFVGTSRVRYPNQKHVYFTEQ